ncbi:ABC transporter permease [Arcanobacterium hippocoleae]
MKQALTLYHVNEITGGVSQDQAAKIAAVMNVPVTIVTGSSNLIGENPIGFFTAVAAQVLLFFAVITGLSTISIGVVEEKSSRVVEILLSSVRPRTLLLGKILGIGLFVLLQLALYISAAVISLKISGLWMGFEISALIVWMIVWILVGFFIFVTISGGISATVSRQEDLGGIITPITIGMMIPFYLGMYLVPALPDSIWTKVLSMIPGFSSFIMPARQAFDTVETWELFLAAGIGIVCLPLLAALSGKIYENSILRMGKRVSLREALSKK